MITVKEIHDLSEYLTEENGVTYKTTYAEQLIDKLGVCACMNEDAIQLLVDILVALSERSEDENVYPMDKVRKLLNNDEVLRYIALQLLENQGLVEHGSSLNSAWIDDAGLELVEWLKGIPRAN